MLLGLFRSVGVVEVGLVATSDLSVGRHVEVVCGNVAVGLSVRLFGRDC